MGILFLFQEEIFHAGLFRMSQESFDVDLSVTKLRALFASFVHVFEMP
jgi:hypothetical protein